MKFVNVICLVIVCFGFTSRPVSSQTLQPLEPIPMEISVSATVNSFDLEPESRTSNVFVTGNNWTQKTRIQYYLSESNEKIETDKYIFQSSADGKLLSRELYHKNNNEWVIYSKTQYYWNDMVLAKISYTSFLDFEYGKITEYRYHYQNGLKVKIEVWDMVGDQSELIESRNFIYSENNVIKEQYNTFFSKGLSVSVTLFKYNSFGKLTFSETSKITDNLPFVQNKTVIAYGPNQVKKSEVNYKYVSGNLFPIFSMIDSTSFNLDSTGKVLSESFIHATLAMYTKHSTYHYNTTNNNFLAKRYAHDSNGQNYGLYSRDKYYFEGDRLVNMNSQFMWNNSIKDKKYKWDSSGRILECVSTFTGSQTNGVIFSYETATSVADFVAPKNLNLISGYPNPFNPSTTLKWNQPVSGAASIHVTNLLGQTVRTEFIHSSAGQQTYQLEMGGFGSGVYFVRIESGGRFSNVLKLILMK